MEQWVDKLIELIDDENKRKCFGENSIKLFNNYYTYKTQYENLKKVLTKL